MTLTDNWLVSAFRDAYVYVKFKKTIRDEKKDPDSKMNVYGINVNKFGNVLYVQYNFTDDDFMGADYNNERMVMRKLKPAIQYLNTELNFGEYLRPEIFQFYDEDDNPTLSYGITFTFVPYVLSKKAIYYLIGSLFLLAGLGFGIYSLSNYVTGL